MSDHEDIQPIEVRKQREIPWWDEAWVVVALSLAASGVGIILAVLVNRFTR